MMAPVALKVQNGIHHMLQHLWTGNGAFLGDMANDQNGEPTLFG